MGKIRKVAKYILLPFVLKTVIDQLHLSLNPIAKSSMFFYFFDEGNNSSNPSIAIDNPSLKPISIVASN